MFRFTILLLLCLLITIPLHAQDDLTPYEIALQRIQEAAELGRTELDLSSLGLTSVPPEIGNLENLSYLYLQYNQLSSLPPEIGNLSNLRILHIYGNQLSSLPPEIGNLSNLYALAAFENQLASLPPEIGNLSHLASASLHTNDLTSLPPEIGNLTILKEIFLSRNQLTELPPEIGNLTNLLTLDLADNQLTELPPEIGNLANLCNLYLENNYLRRLPETMGHIFASTPADPFCFRGNILFLAGNPLVSPPPEVIEQGTGAILAYLRQEAWYHTRKLMLMGAAGIGLLASLMLGFRLKQGSQRKSKKKRDTAQVDGA